METDPHPIHPTNLQLQGPSQLGLVSERARRPRMGNDLLTGHMGKRISLPGHFDVPVVLEDVRPLGADASA